MLLIRSGRTFHQGEGIRERDRTTDQVYRGERFMVGKAPTAESVLLLSISPLTNLPSEGESRRSRRRRAMSDRKNTGGCIIRLSIECENRARVAWISEHTESWLEKNRVPRFYTVLLSGLGSKSLAFRNLYRRYKFRIYIWNSLLLDNSVLLPFSIDRLILRELSFQNLRLDSRFIEFK